MLVRIISYPVTTQRYASSADEAYNYLVQMFTTGIAFLLLALSISRDDDMCSPALLVVA